MRVESYLRDYLVDPPLVTCRHAGGDNLDVPSQFIEICNEVDGWVADNSDGDDTSPEGAL